jgi:hypothetical protein
MHVNCQIYVPAALNTEKIFVVFTEYEAGLAPEPIWVLYKTEKSLAPVKNGTPIPRTSRP